MVLFQVIPLEPEPRVKSSPLIPQELMVSNPQVTVQTLKADLEKLGIVATVKTLDEGWMLEVTNLSTDSPEALSTLLQDYKLRLPPPSESGLKVRVVKNGN